MSLVVTRSAPSGVALGFRPMTRRTDDTVTGYAAGKLLLGHAPVLGGCGQHQRPTDGSLERHLYAVRRMDGSGRSRASPTTTYSVFTANGSVATGSRSVRTHYVRHGGLTRWPSHGGSMLLRSHRVNDSDR